MSRKNELHDAEFLSHKALNFGVLPLNFGHKKDGIYHNRNSSAYGHAILISKNYLLMQPLCF